MYNASSSNNEKCVKWERLDKSVLRYWVDVDKWGAYFEIYGTERVRFLELEVEWSESEEKITNDYYLHWIRDKLKKIENGEIVMKDSEGNRDWKGEERVKKEMWEDINVNEAPKALTFINPNNHYCPEMIPVTVKAQIEQRPPSPPCKLS